LAPTVGIAATGFYYSGGILQLFHRRYQQIFSISSRSTNFATASSSNNQIASRRINLRLWLPDCIGSSKLVRINVEDFFMEICSRHGDVDFRLSLEVSLRAT
jgi:hypothetical protein